MKHINKNRKYLPYNFDLKYNIMFKNDDCYYRLHDYFLEDTECLEFMNGATNLVI